MFGEIGIRETVAVDFIFAELGDATYDQDDGERRCFRNRLPPSHAEYIGTSRFYMMCRIESYASIEK